MVSTIQGFHCNSSSSSVHIYTQGTWKQSTVTFCVTSILQLDGELYLAPGFATPPNLDYRGYHTYLDENLPPESPYLYGLHPNAEIGFLTTTSENLFRTVLEMQPRDASAGGGSGTTREEKVCACGCPNCCVGIYLVLNAQKILLHIQYYCHVVHVVGGPNSIWSCLATKLIHSSYQRLFMYANSGRNLGRRAC